MSEQNGERAAEESEAVASVRRRVVSLRAAGVEVSDALEEASLVAAFGAAAREHIEAELSEAEQGLQSMMSTPHPGPSGVGGPSSPFVGVLHDGHEGRAGEGATLSLVSLDVDRIVAAELRVMALESILARVRVPDVPAALAQEAVGAANGKLQALLMRLQVSPPGYMVRLQTWRDIAARNVNLAGDPPTRHPSDEAASEAWRALQADATAFRNELGIRQPAQAVLDELTILGGLLQRGQALAERAEEVRALVKAADAQPATAGAR